MTRLMNELINYEAVYRTAPATPGLLIIVHFTAVHCTTIYSTLHCTTVNHSTLPCTELHYTKL